MDLTQKELWKEFELVEQFCLMNRSMQQTNSGDGIRVTADDFYWRDSTTQLNKSLMRGRLKHNELYHQIQTRNLAPPASFVTEFKEAKRAWQQRQRPPKTKCSNSKSRR